MGVIDRGVAFLSAALFVATATSSTVRATATVDQAVLVRAVIERTRTTHATYALYNRIRLWRPGQPPVEEWSAEFHMGALHRVETPTARLIADCEAKTGVWFSLVRGRVGEGAMVAATACGIDSSQPVTTQEWLGKFDSPFGPIDRIRLVNAEDIRTYDVDMAGAIIRSTYAKNEPGEPPELETLATDLQPTLPEQAMFDEPSLQRSFVPERYKTQPKSVAN